MANHHILLLLFCTSVLQTVINSQHVCDFEKDLCNWNNHKSIDITWKRKEGRSNKNEAETLVDHTTGSGSYLHLEYQNLTEENVAQIFTPAFLQMDKSYCLSFYYYMSGNFDKVLYIYRYSNNTQLQDQEVITLQGSQDENWRLFQTSFKTETENRLMFEAHLEGATADISIDDVQLKEGNCPESDVISNYESLGNNSAPSTQLPFTCDFQQKDLCGFTAVSGILRWRQGNGIRSYFSKGPVDDHTFRTRSGKYLYVSPYWRYVKRNAQLVSPEFPGKDQSCLQFWYNMYGANVNKLDVVIRNQTVWYAAGDQGYGWKVAYLSVLPGEDFNITFNAWNSYGKSGYIAIDDVRLEQGNCTRPDICNFEGAMCSWTNSKQDTLDWVERKGSKTSRIGPSSDHTFGTTKGTYLFLDASKSKAEDTRAFLTSESFSMRVKAKCLRFFYHMKGNAGQLTVYKENEDKNTELLWTLVGDQGPLWNYAAIEIRPQPKNFYLVIQGIVGLNNTGGIAIDDLAMASIQCKTYPPKADLQKPVVKTTRKSITPGHVTIEPGKVVMKCNFLNDTCKWIQGHDDTSDWIRTKSKNFGGQGPIADHTSANGFYMNLPSNISQTAHFHSPPIKPVAGHPMCLSFWYYMYGSNIESFKVYITKSNLKGRVPHWMRFGTQGNQWKQGKLLILQTQPFKITFEGKVKQSAFGNIAFDDILLVHGTCNELTTGKPDVSVPLAQRSCNFEANDICGFSVENSTNFRWSQHSGSTDTLGTGPTNDHTLESSSGHYMYVSAMDGSLPAKSSLISPFYQNTDSVCLQFYYHMYGNGIGTLNIYTKVDKTMDRIYHISGNQANKWQVDTVTIDIAKTSKNLYRVIFEAVKGPNKRGDIALDDISFTLGACSVKGDCDFEDSNCLWTNVQGTGDNFDWIKLKGPASDTNTGPKFDHTLQNPKGHYQYIEKAKGTNAGRAWLTSPLFQPLTSDKCLQFWYNMNGKDVSRLSVVITVAGSNNITIWQLEGNQGRTWMQGQVSLPRIKKPYSVIFEGINGKEQGGIALDDITFINEGCRILPLKADVKHSMTTNKPTVTKAPVDVSTSCTFTKDFCGWKQDKSDDGDWTIGKSDRGPRTDHTGGDNGRYIFVKQSNQRFRKYRLTSPDFNPTGNTSCVTFWYYKYGFSSDYLGMYIKEGLNLPSSPVLALNGYPAKTWERERYNVHINKTFNVVFEVGSSSYGITALDDVSITHGTCKNDFSQSLSCDFETKDICGFKQDTHGKKFWAWHQGSTSTLNTGPSFDHTYKSYKGHYMFVEGSNTKPNSRVRLFSPVIKQDSSSSCVEFYFNMKGNVGMLSIYLLTGNRSSFLWNRFGHQNSDWQLTSIQITSHKQYQLYFQAIVGGKYDGDIAIDDFTVRSGQCNKQGTCNFENGICDWEMSDENDFDWLIQKANVQSKMLGPLTDHTNVKGHYLLAKPNSDQAGSISKLVSTDFDPTTVNCLHLWYNIYGKSPATMTVYKKASNTSILWQLTDENEGSWKEAQVPISKASEVFSIVIEVKTGNSSYVAIDDTHFNKMHDCARKPNSATAIHTTPKRSHTTKPATVPQKDSFKSCTFSTGFCGWQQLSGSKIKWQLKRGRTATQDTGPKMDHTTGSGNYIYIETSNPVASGDSTHLISPKFQVPTSQEWCLSFWYHMYGNGIGTLAVVYRGKSDVVAWQKRKSQGNKWINGKVNIRGPQELQIIFQATKGKSFTGDIALDDIMITPKQCSGTKASLLSFCDFESSCSLFQSVQSTLAWQLTTNTNRPKYSDHTYKSSLGDYIYVDLTKASAYRSAKFNMPTIHNRTVCVEFFYRALGSFTGTLTVFRKIRDETLPLLKLTDKDVPNEWTFAELEVQSYGDLQLSFYVLSGKDPKGGIAIDDVALDIDHCKPPGSCDFENEHLCHWKNSQSNHHDWIVHSGGTDSQSTGPSADHTTGKQTGSYMYIEASSLKRNEKVRIISELITNNGFTPCFLFWYNMYGVGIGQLNVYIQDSDQRETLMWTLSGNQGRSWQIGKIPLVTSKKDYRVIIEGTANSFRGDIAIDDIYTIPQSCSFYPSRAQAFSKPTTQSPKTTEKNRIDTDTNEMCTFEKGMCMWLQSQNDNFEWKLRQGYTPKQSIGPQGDHTTGSGHYLYIDTMGQTINSKAQIFFLYTPTQNRTRCLKFWYNMRGQHLDYLNVYIQYGTGSNSPAWSKRADQGPNWNLAQVNFDELYMTDMKIIIEGVKGGNSLGNIAIDDTSLTSDSCKEVIGECDFESRSLCGYQPDSKADFKWKWRTGYSSRFSTAPNKDHTYGSSNGHYMHISSRRPRKPKEVARLLSPKYDAPNEDQCVQFYYNIYGRNVGSLNIKLRIHDTNPYDTNSYLQIKGDQQKGWILGMVEIPKMIENSFQIMFEGVIGTGPYGDIAIDDITITPGECEVGGNCDFDHGRCTWTNMAHNKFNWLVGSGSTVSSNTGPVNDHTLQNSKGFYLYIDATYLKKEDKSRYISQMFPALHTEKRCITFWYSMNGDGIGILKILTKFETGTNVTIWELSRDQGNKWLYGQAPIEAHTPYQIIIEATRGRTFEGDIAIDDIIFKESGCSVSPHTAAPEDTNVVIPTGIPPKNTETTKPFNCSFDNGICGWTQDQQDDFDWTEMVGHTQSQGTGPSSDHGGKGHYLYIEASRKQYGQKARLISPLVKSVGMVCVSVYYLMYGSDVKDFKIYVVSGSNSPQEIFSISGSRGRRWIQAQVQYQTLSPVNVILEATRGKGYEGDIAIDDVSVNEGFCKRQAAIGNGKYYNFENSNQMDQMKDDDFNWSLGSGQSARYTSRPSRDHTYRTSRGHYMYLRGNSQLKPDDKAVLSTQPFFSQNSAVCVRFWYFLYGKTAGTLRVQYVSEDDGFASPKSIWMRSDDQGNQWNEANINIENTSQMHIRIEFVGIAGPGYPMNVAIDDVFISNKPCSIKPDSCNFEKGKCEWKNKNTDDFDWVIGSGKYTSLYGPSKDHTFSTTAGSYLFLEPTMIKKYDSSQSNQVAVLESQQFSPSTSKKCFEFYYYINKAKNSSLQMFSSQNGDEELIWHLSGHQGSSWIKGQTSLKNIANPFRVKIKGNRGLSYTGDIALDDMKFTTTKPCAILPSKASPDVIPITTASPLIKIPGFNCSFDKHFCGWKNAQNSRILWKRTKGSTKNADTGPSSDHSGGGYYIYIESSFFSGLFKYYADLRSPTFSITQKACISFYYHMFGENINYLQLILAQTGGTSRNIWIKKGPQKNKWLQGTVSVPAISSSYIIFRGVSGYGSSGDIAIDDVTIHTGECEEDISSNSVDCDFESSDGCQYFQDNSVDYKWVKYYGYRSPFRDHTKHSVFGHFMGAGSLRTYQGKIARLWTPQFALKDGQCLSFWYHMYGRRIGTLNVHVTNVKDVNRIGAAIWSRRGHQGSSWFEEHIPLPNFINAYVIFEGINGGDVIGIDDIKLLNSSCPEPGDCHFEISSCGWHNDGNNTVNWERVSGRTIYKRERHHIVDHTYNSIAGSMMYIGASQSRTKTRGDLVSISFDKTSDSGLCIRFWYIINGNNIGNLSVIMQTSGESTLLWKLSDSQGSAWSQGTFFIKSDSAFTISIRAEIDENASGYLALDDINYDSLRCAVTPLKARPLNQPSTTRNPVTMVSTIATSVLPPGPYDCTFENKNFCGWTQTQTVLKWIISKGSRSGYDPIVDHTIKTRDGSFALFRYSRSRYIQNVKLLSPPIQNYTLTCLSFWFHLYGNRVHSLSVQHMTSNKVFTQVWYHSQPLSREWHPASVTLGLNDNDRIAFQVDSRPYLSGSVALDDIKLTPGHCQTKESCGFEDENLCEFTQLKPSRYFYWKVRDEKAPAVDTQILPRYDHTANSLTGHYMYLRNARVRSGSARLFSKVQRKSSGSCVSFWYSIGGTTDSLHLKVYSLIADIYRNLWSRSSRTGKTWNQAEVTVKSRTHWQVAFLGYSTRYDSQSYIAIDDVKITPGSCPMDGDCNFEKDMCSWSNLDQDNFDWLQTTAADNSAGPNADHSEQTAKGSYIYVLPKWPIQTGERAILVSDPIAPIPQRRCMSFWYYIKGISAGALEVGYANESVLWRLSDNQGDQWHLGKVPLSTTNLYKKMTISASAGAGSRSIIAIDEISFDLKPCGLYPSNAKPVLTSTTSTPTTPTSPPSTFKPNSKFDCSFENGFCSWGQSKNDIFDWSLHQGPTGSTGTGPNVDHTYGTNKGHYIYIESSHPRRRGDTAILTSASFSKNVNYTLEFFYHMYGSTIGGLNVTMTLDGQQKSQLLWSQRTSHSRVWIKAELSIPPQEVPFSISLVGIIGWSVYGDIAVDDIRVFTTKQTEAPLNCTFETSGICEFTIPFNGKYRWKKHTGVRRYPSNAPSFDHTSGTPYGHYMVFENLYGRNNNSTASLITPALKSSADICMSFYYYMHGYKRASLNVYQQINNQNSASLWSDTTDQGSRWVKAQVTLPANQEYKVVFEGVLHSYGAYVAVDDIYSKTGECPDPGDTSFEEDMGTWSNVRNNDVNWIRATGEMPYRLPHPANDHTMNNVKGHYIFLASTSMSQKKGILRSQVFPATTLRCLHFWFYLDGTSPGGIKVYFVDELTEDKTAIWALASAQGSSWNYAQTGFAWKNPYYVEFEGITSKNQDVYTALDDIMFMNDYCTVQPLEAQTNYKFFPRTTSTTIAPVITNSAVDCTFEKDYCKWTHNKSDVFSWRRKQGPTSSSGTGPQTDHTYGNSSGYYIYIEASSQRQNDTASLISPTISPTSNGCFRFWYHMYGTGIDTLTVYNASDKIRSPLWRKQGTIDEFWHQAIIEINFEKSTQLVLEGRRGKSFSGDISIDDISFSDKQCPSSSDFFCDFEETSICGFVQSQNDKFDWVRAQGASYSRNSGPSSDHTFGTWQGHYMYIKSITHNAGDNAILVSPVYKSTAGKCVNFWYHMYGSQIGQLKVYLKTAVSKQLLWSRRHAQGNFWSLAQVKIDFSGAFHLEFEAITEKGSQGNIAIDDFSLTEGQCPKAGNIDFEKGLSTWMNVINDDFDWLIGTGRRYYYYNGPKADHTLRTFYGHYLLLRALPPLQAGNHALLISESLDGSVHQCMTFWYSMYGQGIGTLRFIIVQLGSNVTSWVLSGSQNKNWRFGSFPIASNKPFQIIIEGVRGSSNRVNFAIDDIQFNNKKCSLYPRNAIEVPVSSMIPSSVTTAHPPRTTPIPTQYDCNFEKSMCSWTNDAKAGFKWVRAQGPAGYYRSGPTTDHTIGTKEGWYILSKRSWRIKANLEARIVGPSISSSQTRCLNFWYHMYGAYVNRLQVNVTQGTTTKNLWMKTGDQGNLWRQAFIHMDKDAYKTNYQITFEAVSGNNYRDYIALDDIRFTLGACHENNPTFCDFESEDKCNYTHNKNADFQWTWHHGRTQSTQTGPNVDHTMGTSSGHYFYIETSSKKENQTAQLISPMYHTDTPTCLHFYYFMYGEDVNTLNVYQAFGNQFDELKSPLWNMEHSQGSNWIEGTVTLAAHANYTVIFEGISGKSFRGDIAIDDIYQTDGSCQTPGFCDFEKGLCNWKNDKMDDFDWVIGQGLTLTDETGPIYDHTYNNAKGHYIYIDSSSPIRPGDVAHLFSEHLLGNKKPACLKFWYQMYGKDVNALNVLVRKSFGILRHYDAAYIWTINGNQGQKWLNAQVYIDPKYTAMSHQLIFEAIRGNGSYGDIAIDDVSISQESCSIKPIYADPQKTEFEEVSCSFDLNFCLWQHDSKADFNWTLAGYYKRIKPRTGSGSYIYIKSFSSKKGSNAMIHTQSLAPTSTGGNCLSFWYYMYGSNIGSLNVYMTKFGRKILIWTKRGSQENQWNYAHLNVDNDYNYMLYIEFVSNGRSTGMVAVDDIFMDTNGCPHPRSCDFEVDTCGWTVERKLTNLWRNSRYFSTIPDHTTGTKSGHYIYAQSYRYGRRRTLTARLTSPPFPPASQSCLRFWYNMNVQNSSDLQLYVKTNLFKRKVWERTGNQGKEWWQGHANIVVPLQKLGVTYKLVFQSTQQSGHSEIIALDDIEHLPGPCDPQGLCDFEQGMCGFTNVYGDDFDWIVFSGSKQSFVTGPTEDHTTNSPSGHYMYIDTRWNRNENDRAWLSSWENEPTNATCVSFWYHMYGKGMGELNVLYKNSGTNRTVWHQSGNQGNIWLLGNFTIISSTTYVIIFEGVRGKTLTSDIALDDVRFQNGSCESIVTVPTTTVAPVKRDIFFQCTFEYGLCGWQLDSTTNAAFMISYGVFVYKRGGPPSDHTLGNNFGHYLLLNNSQSTSNRTARFISTDLHITKPICITFWYYMRITNFGQLNVYVHNNGETKPPLWTRSGTQGVHWLYASVDVPNPEKSNKIYFEAIRNHGYNGIALDDIKILIGSCPEMNECDFEEVDICGFEQGTTDKFNWTRGSHSTADRNGPRIDHTHQSIFGHYMYLNMEKHAKDDNAYLYTPQYPATQTERCLSFWYYMYGTYSDKINVYLYQNNKITAKLWSIQISQGPHWRLATVSINSQTPFQILFEGIRSYNSRVIIALDDVKVSQTACEPLASCNFEDGFCGWFNNRLTIGRSLNWVIRTGHWRITKLEPSTDHTIGDSSGYYAHIYSTKGNNGRAAYLESQMVPYEESPRFCFHFWHYMYGTDVGSLTVYVHYHGRSLNAIWTKDNGVSNQWVEEFVTVGNPHINFEMVIGSIAGSNGSIAVDDVMLMKGLCPNMKEDKFTCKSGLKISKEKVCDFIFDCPDYDDEDNCGSCTFEDDMCTWNDMSHGSFEWVRGRNGDNVTESGPSVDHTMGDSQGWFAYIHSNNGTRTRYAVIENRVIQQTSSTCQLNFWYYISSKSYSNNINVELLEGDITTPLMRYTSNSNVWQEATVAIGKVSRPFRLSFYGSRSLSVTSDVAIDDITLIDCNFPKPEEHCQNYEFHCNNKACIDSSQICDLSNDCGDGSDENDCDDFNSCDFDFGLCDWSQDWNDDFDWTRTNGETLSYSTGPKRDHSTGTGTGYYIYTEASHPRKKGQKARLYSPVIAPPSSNECWIRFFYHMNGFQMGTLNVYTRTSVLGRYEKLWTKTGHVADYWERADIQLTSNQKFQVVFESIIGGYSSDIALDDITFLPGCDISDNNEKLPNGTKPKTTPEPCPIGLYACRDRTACVQFTNVCDFEKNCNDNSDEDVCGDCNFETGLCGWKDYSTGKFKWASHQGDTMGKIGPPKDHTSNSIKGKYMRVFTGSGIFPTPAIMSTRPYGETGKNCVIQFYVFLSGDDIGDFNLNMINPVTGKILKKLYSQKSSLGSTWVQKTVKIGAQQRGFSLQFQALPETKSQPLTFTTDIAVDDVKLINCDPAPIRIYTTPTTTPGKYSKSTPGKHPETTPRKHIITTPGKHITKPGKTPTSSSSVSTTHKSIPGKHTTHKTGSSSGHISTTASTMIPIKCNSDEFSCRTKSGFECFPTAYHCDGRKDCLNGEDERSCKACPKDYIYCKPQHKCINATRCNGISECEDNSDESLCFTCRPDMCQKGGVCQLIEGIPKCSCGNFTAQTNFRCLIPKFERVTSHPPHKKTWAIPVGIILALIMVGALVFGIYFFWKKRLRRNYSPSVSAGIDNPMYNYDFKMSELEPTTFSNTAAQGDSTAIENPLYSDLR